MACASAVKDLLFNSTFIRLLLVLSIFYYFPGTGFFPEKKAVTQTAPVEIENGMGGGVAPEAVAGLELDFDEDGDLELSGISEPMEFNRPHLLTYSYYIMEKGDIIGHIARNTGLNEDTLISVNEIKNTRLMQIGQVIRIPNQDGIFHSVKKGDTLESIAAQYSAAVNEIAVANELFSEVLALNTNLFIPGAKMDWVNRQEINGDLFIWPCSGYITSTYGYRNSPFTGLRQFHSGLDIGAPAGAAVRAAMAGRVSHVGFDDSFGNYLLITHHSGYRTLYAHLNTVRVKAGAYVATNERIGDVGNTGLSTGPHLHFTVYKNGVTVNPRSLMK